MLDIIPMYIVYILQIVIAIGLVNVWLVRFNKPTKYRGKGAGNMKDEFSAYGLPSWFMYLVGGAKMLIVIFMVVGLWIPALVCPASIVLAFLMLGAIGMHIKVHDPVVKGLPAIVMFLLAVLLMYFSSLFLFI